jgi:agmatine deiminase
MIPDNNTNTIYFSGLLKTDQRFLVTYNQIIAILDSIKLDHKLLPNTRDIWARDYMPIQVSKDKFIEYRYDPDYLQGVSDGERDLKTYPDIVCDSIGINTFKSNIRLDGGNVVRSSKSIILTEKVFLENKDTYNPKELMKKLKQLFEVEKVIIIPWDTQEEYGHADGMVRFINEHTVLLQGYFDFYPKYFQDNLFGALRKGNLEWVKLNYHVPKVDEKRNWAYINYLQTKDIIMIPKLGIDEDEQALKQIEALFSDYSRRHRIFQVDVAKIVEYGGALNCISWTLKE